MPTRKTTTARSATKPAVAPKPAAKTSAVKPAPTKPIAAARKRAERTAAPATAVKPPAGSGGRSRTKPAAKAAPGYAEANAAFAELRAILLRHAQRLKLISDRPGEIYFEAGFAPEWKK